MSGGRGLFDDDDDGGGGRAGGASGAENRDGAALEAGGDGETGGDNSAWSPAGDALQLHLEGGGRAQDRAIGVREPSSDGRRGPGRPKGATNRKSRDFERWYRAKGYTDPLQAMGAFLTSDPVELQAWLIEHERMVVPKGKARVLAVPSLFEIVREQMTVADRLGPYLHGKKPIQVEITDERLPTLIVDLGTNQLAEGHAIAGRKALSAADPAVPAPASKINDLDVRRKRAERLMDGEGE